MSKFETLPDCPLKLAESNLYRLGLGLGLGLGGELGAGGSAFTTTGSFRVFAGD